MKSDFITIKQQLPGIVRVVSDFYQTPRKKGSVFFVKSPATHDKTASLALYPSSNRFCDFANGNHSGDIIGFISYVKGVNNWEALQTLKAFYGLTDSWEQEKEEIRRRIELQQQEEHRREERKQAFYRALWTQIEDLKRWAVIYSTAIEKRLFEPFSDTWAYCVNELQTTEYRLDILTGADCKAYPRLKAYSENLPSDRYQWLLDCLAILQGCGAFEATADELKEIKAQAVFEVQRKPGAERRCKIEW